MSIDQPLTPLEQRVLAAIERHIGQHGQSPTIAELAGELRLRSKGTVHRYVQSLIDKERLHRQGTGWRGLRVVGMAPLPGIDAQAGDRHEAAPASVEQLARASDSNVEGFLPLSASLNAQGASSQGFEIPLLGRIAAGQPIEAIEDQRHLDLAEFFIGPDRYALRVTGNSMIEAGILDGDTVILRKTSLARPGDVVVALIDGQEATLKRLGECADGLVELIPENRDMSPMRYSEERVSFQGVLVGQLRSY